MIIAKYKFDNTIADCIPVFNNGYSGYTYTDIVEENITTRTIECDTLPTRIGFGYNTTNFTVTEIAAKSLLEVLDINVNATTMYCMFSNCQNLTSLDVSNLDTSKVNNMSYMFSNCQNLTSLDVSNFNTSNVTTMDSMFNNCNNLTLLDVSNFNTSNVTTMDSMFNNCNNLTLLDVSNFNTSKVTDMQGMFYGCNKLTLLDVSNFNTSNVTNMYCMFYACYKLTSLDISNWDTSKVTTMSAMFFNCNNLTTLDVSNFDTSKVTSMRSMFYNCYNLTTLDVSNFDTSKVTDMFGTFANMISLTNLITPKWNTEKVTVYFRIFKSIPLLTTLDLNGFTINAEDYTEMFLESNNIKYIRCDVIDTINKIAPILLDRTNLEQGIIISDVELSEETRIILNSKNWTVVSSDTLTKVAEYVYDSKIWRSMIPEFNSEFIEYFIDDEEDESGLVTRTISNLGELPTLMRFGSKYENGVEPNLKPANSLLDVIYLNSDNLTDIGSMFRHCKNLTKFTCPMNTEKVTGINFPAFQYCYGLEEVDVTGWDLTGVTSLASMFHSCGNLKTIHGLNTWNTKDVTGMGYMFYGCINLTSLDVSNFNTSNVTSMYAMFHNCSNLTSLDISNFNTSNVTNMQNIFINTSKLSDIGMLYCTPSTINTISSNLPTTRTQTIWVKDTKPSECTVVSGVEFKEYKENSVMINLSSPLLQGDRIEVKDGKLCHYHKMGSVVLDGSEDENYKFSTYLVGLENLHRIYYINDSYDSVVNSILIKSNNFRTSDITNTAGQNYECIGQNYTYNASIQFNISKSKLATQDIEGFKQWLQANPTTVVYELAEPYYEDITPLQSDITLETYLESNLDIYTDLPIKTNLTYLTNITNTSSIEEEINAINEGTDLTNLLEDEINN